MNMKHRILLKKCEHLIELLERESFYGLSLIVQNAMMNLKDFIDNTYTQEGMIQPDDDETC